MSTDASTTARRAAVIYNPIKVDLDQLRAAVEAEETAAGWQPSLWLETSKEDPGQGVASEAVEAGVDMILAAGGDGTVRAVAEAMHESSASLALLPSGTGNLLARNLQLTLDDLPNSVHVAFAGEDRDIDLGLIEIEDEAGETKKYAYVVMAGLGLDAKMLSGTDEDLKAKVGWLAYVKAITTAFAGNDDLRFTYRLDGAAPKSMRAHTLIVGNCGSLPANIVLLPDATIDDGEFDILLLRPQNVLGWIQIFGKVLWENGIVRRTVLGEKLPPAEIHSLRYVRAKKLSVELETPQEIELDGDPFGIAAALKTWVKPGGLTVRVPTEEDRATAAATLASVGSGIAASVQDSAAAAREAIDALPVTRPRWGVLAVAAVTIGAVVTLIVRNKKR